MIGYITSLLKGSIIFIGGFTFGMIAGLTGLTIFLTTEVFGIPLLYPMIFIFVFVRFFAVIFFKKDKIEQIKGG